ncbi:MAG TPA: hypothetical protein VN259_00215 [Xanthomonadales bacterium]|nr:hypothetical protein [Xanthomonadales bacterium]
MSDWLPILIFPACALLAVVVIALVQKGKELDDRGLLLSFAVLFSMALLLALGLLRTHWAQARLDPTIELAAQLQAHPVIVALEQFHGDDNLALRTAMLADMDRGQSLSATLQKNRPALSLIAQDRLGFADEAARIDWSRVELQALRELARRDVKQCATLALSQTEANAYLPLASGMSAENQQAFEAAFVAMLASADAGLRKQGTPPSQVVDFNQAQQRYVQLHEPLKQRFGASVDAFFGRRQYEQMPPITDAQLLCDYRIAQLDAYLREPPAMAARLLDSAMR